MRNRILSRSVRNSFTLIAGTSLVAFGTGCPRDNAIPDRGRVQAEWAKTIRELAIVPTFPPREDFQVGDVYVTHYDPSSPELELLLRKEWDQLTAAQKAVRQQVGMQVRLMQLDIAGNLSAEYETRMSAPSSGFDANRLEEVPAIALARNDVADKAKAVAEKIEEVKVAAGIAATAQGAIDSASAVVTTAKTNQARKEADLAESIKRGADVSKERAAEASARESAAEAERAIIDMQKQIDLAQDAAVKKQLETKMIELKATRDIEKNRLATATAALTAAVAAGPDVSSRRADVDIASKATRDAEDELAKVTAARLPVVKAAQALVEKGNADLVALKLEVTKAEAKRDQLIAAAMLLNVSQSAYANRNVFTGQELAQDYGKTMNPSNINRLRLVGFPDFVTVNFFGADAAAMVPVEAVNLGISLSSQDISGVTVKIPAAESYALPTGALMTKVVTGVGDRRQLSPKIKEALVNYPEAMAVSEVPTRGAKVDPDAGRKYVYITIVNEVFYARVMDLSVNYSSTGAARVTASLPIGSAPATTQPNGAPIGATDSLQSMLANVQTKVGQTQTIPGGSLQVIGGNAFGVGLRRTFDRPVAIGFRGFTIKYELSNPDQPKIISIIDRIGETTQSIQRFK